MVIHDGGSRHNSSTLRSRETDPLPDPDPNLKYRQDPIAIIGLANRLPGDSNSPSQLWEFLEQGGVAQNDPPKSRFSLDGHFDKSLKPHTLKTPGAMFLEHIDPAEFDAAFFNINRADAIAMDPQQRQLLEVVYEGLENAGLTLAKVEGALFGCFVGSYAVDYQDMQFRDPENRATGITVGAGRAILSNRISHFLNLKGASMTIDTACSGSLVSVDVACRSLQTRQINGAIVAGVNLYLSPDQNQDMGAMRVTSSATGRCHTFDAKADGYCKAEAVNAIILKRLDDAIREGDPVRAVIRGTSTNSDGWTPGIASPSAEAQAVAIRAAYSAAGMTNFNHTAYLECHGTGTLAGDPVEVAAAASVFSPTRSANKPLIIGSIKSNIGHSEPAAGINGLLKAVLAVEKGMIPGNPTFVDPNPKIDFKGLKVHATRTAIPWPDTPERIASVNSFGYGGSNAHVVLQDAESFCKGSTKNQVSSFPSEDEDFFADEEVTMRPRVLVFSGNDEQSLKLYCQAIRKHLINPSVRIGLSDLAYTLSERRSHHFNRGYVVTQSTNFDEKAFFSGKKNISTPNIGFVFTGQGAQWSQMGKSLTENFPVARTLLKHLDDTLQALPDPPHWLLLDELVEARSPEHLRHPEFSQPLVTALQLALLNILQSWGVEAKSVVGHSSGEIAAACAAGHLTPEDAIKIAFYRGQAAKQLQTESDTGLGMMAVGLGAENVQKYISDSADFVQIACYNSANSVTLSGKVSELEKVKVRLQTDNHFVRLLQVNLAYHSPYMLKIGERYEKLLEENVAPPLPENESMIMFSSLSGDRIDQAINPNYWKNNMVKPVRFHEACQKMLSGREGADFLIEIGPSGALAGPIGQIKKELSNHGSSIQYHSAAKRGPDSAMPLFDVAGRLFIAGGSIDLCKVNEHEQNSEVNPPATIIDLPNYAWNHSTRYWHESDASEDWRFRTFVHHDLLGSKILGTPWHSPIFRKTLDLKDVPWIKDHKMGSDVLFPASGYIAMAIEALYQHSQSTNAIEGVTSVDKLRYRLRNINFDKALVLDENNEAKIMLTLVAHPGTKGSWYHFKVSSSRDEITSDHCHGLIRLENLATEVASEADLAPLKSPTPGALWYKALNDVGYGFGPLFQKHLAAESVPGERKSRSHVSLTEPPSAWSPQSLYPMHPACIDACFQTVTPSLWAGNRSAIDAVLVPAIIDDLIINPVTTRPEVGVSVTSSEYVGRGRPDENKNYLSGCSIYDPNTGSLLLRLIGLRYHKLDIGNMAHSPHTYNHSVWKPDVTFLSQEQLDCLITKGPSSKLDNLIDLIAHKKPASKVMEINLSPADITSIWFHEADRQSRAAYSQYSFVSPDALALINVQTEFESHRNTVFNLLDITKPDFTSSESDFDLVIIKRPILSGNVIASVAQNARGLLSNGGYVLLVEQDIPSADSDLYDDGLVTMNGEDLLEQEQLTNLMAANSFHHILNIPCDNGKSAYLSKAISLETNNPDSPQSVCIARLSERTHYSSDMKTALQESGWQISEHSYPFSDMDTKSTVLILDELTAPLLATVSGDQWQAIKHLITQGHKILWVTKGSQFDVTKPDNALVHGFFRTIRAEDPSLNLTTLDVETSDNSGSLSAIGRLLTFLKNPAPKVEVESEFVERSGIIYVNRILPDGPINQIHNDENHGTEPVTKSLHDLGTTAMLRAERIGTLERLAFSEISRSELPMKDNNVEVEIFAAGLNFKDVAVTMGIVPENEYLLGLEGAGYVRRVGKNADNYKVGDRVAVLRNGTFANRIQVPIERTHLLPDFLSFEDAATIPLVYLTSLYSLFNVGKLQKGQLAQYTGAEIFVTVGSEDKRKFLKETFGIAPERMFSSRTTKFASEIMDVTQGKGIDIIINSLTGDLLDETWRICADGGTMIEIGKRDIVDRNYLSMEPFDRNCSFRAVDFSHKQVTDTLIASLMAQTFDLIKKRHIKPINPIKTFPFSEIASAFAYMRSGRHIGKIVISNDEKTTCEVPVRPACRKFTLRSDVSYLIVGGLKGLCGSLAIHMAQSGAKHLIIVSRSGCGDEKSQGVVMSCNAIGCQIEEEKADISNVEDVRRVFKNAIVPIGGVVQGAMALRDKPFEIMTVEEYHTTISSKVQGTWNLHNAALEHKSPLDFFTMLSSISGVVGQKGQANYAAANVFMDAFAKFRHSLGLPANSTDLGVIEDVGHVAENESVQNYFDKRQWTGINESALHKILNYSIFQQISPINKDSASQLITGISVPQPADSDMIRDARFGGLFIGDDSGTAGKGGNDSSKEVQTMFLLHRSGADSSAVLASAVEIVNKQFTKTLRLEEPMEPAKSLATYGLDSLSAVEFRNWARMELESELTLLEITSATSLYSLCEKIVSKITVKAVDSCTVKTS